MSKFRDKYLPFFMWLFPLSFFTYQFILRIWPSLMMQDIMQQFAIDASGYGLLAASYYWSYSLMQIPVAILLDKYGARRIVCAGALLTGCATLLFSSTDSFAVAIFSRACVGLGSAVGFLGVSKVISEWFPKNEYRRMISFSFTIGLMGAIYGGKPVSLLISDFGGGEVAYILAMVAIGIGVLAFCFLRSSSSRHCNERSDAAISGNLRDHNAKDAFNMKAFKGLLSSKTIWMLGIANFLMVGSLEGFADVWGVSYLQMAYNLLACYLADHCLHY